MIKNRVLFQRDASETQTDGGLLIPDIALRPGVEAAVLAIGPDCEEVAVGDRVIVELFQGTELKYGARSYWIVAEDRIGAKCC